MRIWQDPINKTLQKVDEKKPETPPMFQVFL
jgi:hypothetical protein